MPAGSLVAPAVPFVRSLADHGDSPAVIVKDGCLTYADLTGRIEQMAARLGTGRRLVLVAGVNEVEPLVVYLAALSAGHPVLLAPEAALAALIEVYDPDVVYRRQAGQWVLEHRHREPGHDLHPNLAVLLTTSGTTGSPKLVRLSHDNLQANAAAIADCLDIRPTDRGVTTLPLAYCYGLSVVHSHLLRGAAVVLTDLSVADRCFWELFRSSGGTSFAGVPYTFDLLDRVDFADLVPPSLRYVTQAGGSLAPERVRRYAELGQTQGWDLVVMYGQTEATARMAYLPPDLAASAPTAIGRPIPGGTFSLAEVSAGVGELVYEGPNVMLGYATSRTDLALGSTIERLHTGDLARCRPDGLYELVGRQERFAKVFGLRIDLHHIEQGLADQGVQACCVEVGGGLVLAVERPADPDRIRSQVAQGCGLPSRAVRAHAVDALPRLATGKPDLTAVAALTSPAPSAAPTDLRELYAQVLDRRGVTAEDSFVSLGGDSLSYVEMSVRLEQALGHLPADWHVTAIRDLVPRPSRRRTLETSVALRALAILLIVGTHADVFDLSGGAHVLIGVAGFNVARFVLSRRDRIRGLVTSTARIVVPSVLWIAGAAALSDDYGLTNVLLVNSVVGTDQWSPAWHFWFLEALVQMMLGLTAVLSLPALGRLERRHPFAFAAALLGLGLVARYAFVDNPNDVHTVAGVLWLFALGWAAARSPRIPQRLALTGVLAAGMPGFFTDPRRGAFVVAGLALLIWVPSLRSTARVNQVASVLASSSLYIYLTHWLVYPRLEDGAPLLAVGASLAVGIGYWRLSTKATAVVTRVTGRPAVPTDDFG